MVNITESLTSEEFLILRGDALQQLTELAAQGIAVDCVITSPPYFQQRSYGESSSELGKERSVSEYIANLVKVFQAIPLSPWASIWVNIGDKRGKHGELLNVPDLRHLSLRDDLRRLRRESETGEAPVVPETKMKSASRLAIYAASVALIAAAAFTVYLFRSQSSSMRMNPAEWTQITDFSDSAVSPALSPDGHMLAFLRGDDPFFGEGQIYAKLLPDGEAVQLTHDGIPKMSPRFSLDGSRIYYTEISNRWDTWMVPVLGGEPRMILANAEGLSRIDEHNILFSEVYSSSIGESVESGGSGSIAALAGEG